MRFLSTCVNFSFLLLLAAGSVRSEAAVGSRSWDSAFGPYHLRGDEVRDILAHSSSSSDNYWGKGWGLHARHGSSKRRATWSVAHHPQLRLTTQDAKLPGAASTQAGHRDSEAWIVPALSRVMEGKVVPHERTGNSLLPSSTSPPTPIAAPISAPAVAIGAGNNQHLTARGRNAALPVRSTTLGEAEEEAEYSPENAPPNEPPEAHDNLQEDFKGNEGSVSEVDVETREFEDDMKNAFDLNKITFAQVPLHYWAWWIALVFAVLTCLISGQLIMAHLEKYEKPDVQKYVVRILFMAPIYAIDAFLSLTFDNAAPFLNVLRDCYEAFTLYNFIKMLYELLGGERTVIEIMSKKKQIALPIPLHWIEPWAMGDEMFYNCKFGVLQYIVIIPICAIVTFITVAAGAYEGPEWYTMDLWITIVSIASATWAIYCLITFYLSMQEELEASVSNALGKFLVVKAVVFLCFWQGVALNLVLIIGYIPETTQYSAKHFVGAIEQWLICMEMLIIAICFYLVYPVEEFTNKTEMQTRTYGSTGKKQEEGTSFV
uniref:Transmembrane protein n=2 Tax=Guillardia theta TaxID=55529 RepID=A0A7S4JCE0_GUITH|mmetsp:Transcript_15098/g.50970  ORF Transcript_15098/g.50970 Transcript_15098/m.50970 type:complete len:544 (+) Transcript_15098:78-1709(+)